MGSLFNIILNLNAPFASFISHSMLAIKGSESIGWRLATQERTTSFLFTRETEFSPSMLPKTAASKGEKKKKLVELFANKNVYFLV